MEVLGHGGRLGGWAIGRFVSRIRTIAVPEPSFRTVSPEDFPEPVSGGRHPSHHGRSPGLFNRAAGARRPGLSILFPDFRLVPLDAPDTSAGTRAPTARTRLAAGATPGVVQEGSALRREASRVLREASGAHRLFLTRPEGRFRGLTVAILSVAARAAGSAGGGSRACRRGVSAVPVRVRTGGAGGVRWTSGRSRAWGAGSTTYGSASSQVEARLRNIAAGAARIAARAVRPSSWHPFA